MSLPFILAALVALVLLWLGYVWPPFGQHVRRVSGPWLINFDHAQYRRVVMRDSCTTIGILAIVSLAWLPAGSAAFAGVGAIGLIALFGGALLADRLDSERHATMGITLLFRDSLSHAQLIAFLQDQGAMIAGRQQPFLARLESPPLPIWIHRVHEPIPHITVAMIASHPVPTRASAFLQAQTLLNADIQTNLYLSTTPRSAATTALQQLACAFHHHWPCVIVDATLHVMSGTELCNRTPDAE